MIASPGYDHKFDHRGTTLDLTVRCQLQFFFEIATPDILRFKPQSGDAQRISQLALSFEPELRVDEFKDSFANICDRVVLPPEPVRITLHTQASVAGLLDTNPAAGFVKIQDLPVSQLPFLLPSRYCESDRLGHFAADLVRGMTPGYLQVNRVCDWIRGNLPYTPGCSVQPLSALEVR